LQSGMAELSEFHGNCMVAERARLQAIGERQFSLDERSGGRSFSVVTNRNPNRGFTRGKAS
jgi:hypothetical protein